MSRQPQTVAPETAQSTAEESRAEHWFVLTLAAAVFMSVLNTTMVNVALPVIRDVFSVSEAGAGWLATLYSLFFGIMTPFYGRLGDRYGLRRMYITGLVIFAVSSLLASLVPSGVFGMLIAFRVGQGIGSAAIPPLGTAMIMQRIPSERRGAAIGMIAASVGAGQAIGPTLGGALTDFISWRAVFLVSALIALLIPVQLRLLPRASAREHKPVDWFGGIALGLTIAALMIGVGSIEQRGVGSVFVLGTFAVALAGLGMTAWRQRSVSHPFIDRELLKNRRYVLYCFTAFTMMSAAISTLIILPFLLQDVNGLETWQVGLVLLSQAAMVTFLSRPVGRLADRIDAIQISTAGLITVFAVNLIFATFAVGWPVWALVPLLIAFGIGQASTFPPLQTTVTRIIPNRVAGTGIGLYNMLFFVGSASGASIATALLSARQSTEALFPLYAGSAEYSYFGDAFLYGLAAAGVGITLLQISRRLSTPGKQG